jgi:hypothetical protein
MDSCQRIVSLWPPWRRGQETRAERVGLNMVQGYVHDLPWRRGQETRAERVPWRRGQETRAERVVAAVAAGSGDPRRARRCLAVT